MEKITCAFMIFCILTVFSQATLAQNMTPPADKQIKAALSPAPEMMRDEAEVLGYSNEGELVLLREGSNELVCLANDPSQEERFHVACYHKDLEPFMKRGRELRREGKSSDEIKEIRQQEIESGDIELPEKPMALYSLTGPGDGYDYNAEVVREASPLYVVYIPYATETTTGIAPQPASEGAPWLMDAGKPWAHIMISTGRTLGENNDEN